MAALPPAEAAIAATWLGPHTVIPVRCPPGDPPPQTSLGQGIRAVLRELGESPRSA